MWAGSEKVEWARGRWGPWIGLAQARKGKGQSWASQRAREGSRWYWDRVGRVVVDQGHSVVGWNHRHVVAMDEELLQLRLIEEEDEIIDVVDADSEERSAQIVLYLYGKLLTSKSFNPKAMKSILKNIWKPERGVVIRELDSNLFAFQFFSTADKGFVLNEGSWCFDGKILLLTEVTGLEQPLEIQFNTA
ncbi:hypothetical protein Cgig2_009348 [Carnegiea gigantea]|uniref:DUF4283 domain-containing protein n=1 Tax=Carnegiea gigantea TaxID=171969 RepID=A0A9Q1JK50_9CARY|nr:hypothetical protein Cgig2_009348 [Carnegiea gigantea]